MGVPKVRSNHTRVVLWKVLNGIVLIALLIGKIKQKTYRVTRLSFNFMDVYIRIEGHGSETMISAR